MKLVSRVVLDEYKKAQETVQFGLVFQSPAVIHSVLFYLNGYQSLVCLSPAVHRWLTIVVNRRTYPFITFHYAIQIRIDLPFPGLRPCCRSLRSNV